MEQIMKNESNGDYLQIDDDILNTQIRCRELINWLNLALGELETTPCLCLTILLTFYHPAITSKKTARF